MEITPEIKALLLIDEIANLSVHEKKELAKILAQKVHNMEVELLLEFVEEARRKGEEKKPLVK